MAPPCFLTMETLRPVLRPVHVVAQLKYQDPSVQGVRVSLLVIGIATNPIGSKAILYTASVLLTNLAITS